MPSKDLKSAISKNRINLNETNTNLGVVGLPKPAREELEKSAENLAITEMPIGTLHDNPFQYLARQEINQEVLAELADSIKINGFYGALLARPIPNRPGEYEIAYGHRRREAAKLVGLQTLPVKVMQLDNKQMARVMASENFSREDLTVIGEVNVVGHLYDTENLTETEIAEIIGKKRDWVSLRLAVHLAGPEMRELVTKRPDTLGHVRLLRQVKDGKLRNQLIKEVIEQDLTREQLTARIDQTKQKNNEKSKSNAEKNIVTEITDSVPSSFGEINHKFNPIVVDEYLENEDDEVVTEITDSVPSSFGEINHKTRTNQNSVISSSGQDLYSQGLISLQRSASSLIEARRKNPSVKLSDTGFAVLQKVIEDLTELLSSNYD